MTPELQNWVAQVPWVPVGMVVAVGLLAFVATSGSKKKKSQLLAKLEAGAHVLDVRSKEEYAGGHYPGALNFPVDTIQSRSSKIGSPDQPVIVYCASGGRSAQAAQVLRSAGFTDVTDAGGMANLPHRNRNFL